MPPGTFSTPVLRTVGVFLLLTAVSCARSGFESAPSDEQGTSCLENADCPEVCVNERCVSASNGGEACDEDADCVAGYVCDGSTCVDADECAGEGESHHCDPNAICTNTVGGFTCECGIGYAGDGITCGDEDGCVGNLCADGGDESAICTDAVAPATGHSCICSDGYFEEGAACVAALPEGSACVVDDQCESLLYCVVGICERWFNLGESALGPRYEDLTWGSAAGDGVSNFVEMSSEEVDMAVDGSGYPVLVWQNMNLAGTTNFVYVKRWNGTTWVEVGTGSASGSGICASCDEVWAPVIALDASGNPAVAWGDYSVDQIHLRRWNGATWEEIGGSATDGGVSNSLGSAGQPSIAVDGSGNPVVAWEDDSDGDSEIFVRRWDGTSWEEIAGSASGGGVSDNDGSSRGVSLALDSSNHPVMGWTDSSSGTNQVYVKRFDGTASWEEVGVGSASGGGVSQSTAGASEVDLALDDSGHPVVVWRDPTSGNDEIYAKRWSGTVWEEMAGSASGGGVSNNSGWSTSPSIATDSSGNSVVSWYDSTSGGGEIYLRHWNGTSWEELGSSGSGGGLTDNGDSFGPVVGCNGSGRPVVAFVGSMFLSDFNIYLKHWTGTAWEPLGAPTVTGNGVSNSLTGATNVCVAMDSAGNPALTWTTPFGSNREIYLKRWNGTQWEELAGSATGGGISNSPAWSDVSSFALDDAGNPVVAWHDSSAGNYEIYLKRWSGSAWEELAGSATAGGISDNAGSSSVPSLALEGSGNPVVAWQDSSGGNFDIYLARWNGSAWEGLAGSATGGGISNNATGSLRPSMALESSGNPVVVWEDNGEIFARRWNGTSWEELAGSATGGGISNNAGSSLYPTLGLESSGNPVVAWHDSTSGDFRIYVKRWNGTLWEELDGSASGVGLSTFGDDSIFPSLIVDSTNNPVVSWQAGFAGGWVTEVLMKRWTGSAWEEVGVNSATITDVTSATDGGVSNTPGTAQDSSLAASGEMACVAWEDETAFGVRQAFLRCARLGFNECLGENGGHNCHVNADCLNTVESFTCDCKPGYTGDGVISCVE